MDEFNSRLDIPKERVNELKITQKKINEGHKHSGEEITEKTIKDIQNIFKI